MYMQVSMLQLVPESEQAGLSLTLSQTLETDVFVSHTS